MLLDVQMPEMDGFEVASRIRATESGREVPIIFLTAIHRDEGYARKGYASGAADYITKPYDPDILRARVKAFADLFRQREELRARDVEVRTRERDEAIRRLVAFERISSAALEEGGLTSLLPKLLGVFLEAADSADSATLFLREGDVLRVRASVGRTTEKVGRTVPFGSGLAGVIASTASPLLPERRLRCARGRSQPLRRAAHARRQRDRRDADRVDAERRFLRRGEAAPACPGGARGLGRRRSVSASIVFTRC